MQLEKGALVIRMLLNRHTDITREDLSQRKLHQCHAVVTAMNLVGRNHSDFPVQPQLNQGRCSIAKAPCQTLSKHPGMLYA